jgi:hypothetical protein
MSKLTVNRVNRQVLDMYFSVYSNPSTMITLSIIKNWLMILDCHILHY